MPRLGIVDAAFEQRLSDPLRKTAMNLPFDDHRIDDVAEVVYCGPAIDRRMPRSRIDLDLANVGARGEREVGRIVERVLVESGFELVERIVVRDIRGQRDARERDVLVGAGDAELAVLELDVVLARFEQVRGDLLALGDHLVDGFHDRGAADGERTAAVRAHPEQHLRRVAVLDVDIGHRNAKTIGGDLRERRLVALPMRMRAGEDRHLSGRMDTDLSGFEQTRTRTERAGNVRWRDPAGFDVARVADPAQLAVLFRRRLARGKPADVSELFRLVHDRVIVAAVVQQRDRRLVRERGDEVATTELALSNPHLLRRDADQPLDQIRRLGPTGAAIGVDRRRVGEHRGDFAMNHRRRVLAREQRRVQDRRDARRERGQVRAHVRRRLRAQREKLAVLVECQLGVRDVITAVRVGEKRFTAIARPLDRTIDQLRRPDAHGLFGVQVDLRAEAAAYVRRNDAHLVLR